MRYNYAAPANDVLENTMSIFSDSEPLPSLIRPPPAEVCCEDKVTRFDICLEEASF